MRWREMQCVDRKADEPESLYTFSLCAITWFDKRRPRLPANHVSGPWVHLSNPKTFAACTHSQLSEIAQSRYPPFQTAAEGLLWRVVCTSVALPLLCSGATFMARPLPLTWVMLLVHLYLTNTFLILALTPAHWFDFLVWSQTCLVTMDFLISTVGWLWLLSLDLFGYGGAAPLLVRSPCCDSWLLKKQPVFAAPWCLARLHPLITMVIKYCYDTVWDSVTLNKCILLIH